MWTRNLHTVHKKCTFKKLMVILCINIGVLLKSNPNVLSLPLEPLYEPIDDPTDYIEKERESENAQLKLSWELKAANARKKPQNTVLRPTLGFLRSKLGSSFVFEHWHRGLSDFMFEIDHLPGTRMRLSITFSVNRIKWLLIIPSVISNSEWQQSINWNALRNDFCLKNLILNKTSHKLSVT